MNTVEALRAIKASIDTAEAEAHENPTAFNTALANALRDVIHLLTVREAAQMYELPGSRLESAPSQR